MQHYGPDGKEINIDTIEDINSEIKCFNWGAFFIGWIWAIFNGAWKNVWPIFLIQVICFVLANFFLSFLFFLIIFVLEVYIGFKGNEWSYYGTKKWKNLEHFTEVQRIWAGASIVISLFLNSVLFSLFTLFSILKPKSPKIKNGTVETSRIVSDSRNSKFPTLQGIKDVNYSFKSLKSDTLSYLKTKSEYKDYFTGKKLVIYFTGADCPYAEMFNTALGPLKSDSKYTSQYTFYPKNASGYQSYDSMEDAKSSVDFENTCHEFCIVNTKKGQIFSIDGIGENEADQLSSIIDQLQDW